ncbi:MAG: hypothetical protein IPJ41_14245 [Phycisphaerales bacterium]|nr:hypothetical protein [Phycisphaerales bacterium]
MSQSTNAGSTRVGLLGAAVLLAGLGGCAGNSARNQYYASRAVVRQAEPGDGSVTALRPGAGEGLWSASLTFVPIDETGDYASAD